MRDALEIQKEVETETAALSSMELTEYGSLALLREAFIPISKSYFTLAAMTRRTKLEEDIRAAGLGQLFRMRTLIESRLLEQLRFNAEPLSVLSHATNVSGASLFSVEP